MTTFPVRRSRRFVVAAFVAAIMGFLAVSSPAEAWWRGGYYGGPPIVVGPPAFYAPPPVYYPPPPAYYPPPYYPPAAPYAAPGYYPAPAAPAASAAPGTTCYAGAYTCPLGQSYQPGAVCACPTGHAVNAYGRAG